MKISKTKERQQEKFLLEKERSSEEKKRRIPGTDETYLRRKSSVLRPVLDKSSLQDKKGQLDNHPRKKGGCKVLIGRLGKRSKPRGARKYTSLFVEEGGGRRWGYKVRSCLGFF